MSNGGNISAAQVNLRPDQLVQKNLGECIQWIEDNIPLADRRFMENMTKPQLILCHFGLGMLIRNSCNLWTAGCAEVVKDIERIMQRGIPIHAMASMKYNFNPDLKDPNDGPSSIYHPDNCSGVIIDLYHDMIRGDIGLGVLERKP